MYDILYKFVDLVFMGVDWVFNLKWQYDGTAVAGGGAREMISAGDVICYIVIFACLVDFIIRLVETRRSDE